MATKNLPTIHFIKNYKLLFGTTDHKQVGLLYLFFATINFMISGSLILLIRVELLTPVGGLIFPNGNLYNSGFSTHGISMIFLTIMPIGAGFGNYLVPKLIGAKDMYWPKWNNAAFWMLIPAALCVYTGFSSVGWTFYAPLSTQGALTRFSMGTNLAMFGILIAGTSSVIAALNFLLTILRLRKPGLSLREMDLFSWSIFFTSIIQVFATPFITIAFTLLLITNITGAVFFDFLVGSGPLLYQHLFWSYSHPAVYIMILPAMGLTSLIISRFSQRKIFGHVSMIYSLGLITVLGFFVWGHHMFTITLGARPNWAFTLLTFAIAIPSGIKTFNWVLTLWRANIKRKIPLYFSLGFVIGFILGGFTGIMVNTIPIDFVYHDTYFVVGHFHFIVIGGAVSTSIGAIYFIFPDIVGKMYNTKLAKIQFWIWVPAFIVTFMGMTLIGAFGMPRRYFDYSGLSTSFGTLNILNIIISIGAFAQGLSFVLLFCNLLYSTFKGKPATANPFNLQNPLLLGSE